MSIRSLAIWFPLILLFVLPPAVQAAPETEAAQKAVLVTGASSGIGRNIAERLAREGFLVYAGARKDEDLQELGAIDNVESLRLDVTAQDDIDAAVKTVRRAGRGLYAVVNNAGVAVFAPMQEVSEKDILWLHNVNVLGPYRVNNAFMPLLVESGGRTLTIGSISGFISGARSGAYSMSKFAVEAYTDALAEELADSGVSVSVIEPGGYRSKIREKVTLHTLIGGVADEGRLTPEQRKALESTRERNAALKEPDEVSSAVLHALTAARPKLRYMVVPNPEQADATLRAALGRVVQLNAEQEYSYSREQLVALLDELLAAP
ncbi:MAG: SDR family oxidoreductase [Pseudomonadota bacterium]